MFDYDRRPKTANGGIMFKVRLATQEDREEVMALYKEHKNETYNLFIKWRNIKRFFNLDDTIELYVCEETETGKIVGAVTHRYFTEDGIKTARSNCGLTHRDYRHKGLSKMRRNFALQRYWEKGVEKAVRARKVGTRSIDLVKEKERGWDTEPSGCADIFIFVADPSKLKLEE